MLTDISANEHDHSSNGGLHASMFTLSDVTEEVHDGIVELAVPESFEEHAQRVYSLILKCRTTEPSNAESLLRYTIRSSLRKIIRRAARFCSPVERLMRDEGTGISSNIPHLQLFQSFP